MWEGLNTNEKEILNKYCAKQIKIIKILLYIIQCTISCIAIISIYNAIINKTTWIITISIIIGVILTTICLYIIQHEYIIPTKYITNNLIRTQMVKPLNKRIRQEKILFWTITHYEIRVLIRNNNVPESYWVQTTKKLYDSLEKYMQIRIIQLIPNNYKYMLACDYHMETLL